MQICRRLWEYRRVYTGGCREEESDQGDLQRHTHFPRRAPVVRVESVMGAFPVHNKHLAPMALMSVAVPGEDSGQRVAQRCPGRVPCLGRFHYVNGLAGYGLFSVCLCSSPYLRVIRRVGSMMKVSSVLTWDVFLGAAVRHSCCGFALRIGLVRLCSSSIDLSPSSRAKASVLQDRLHLDVTSRVQHKAVLQLSINSRKDEIFVMESVPKALSDLSDLCTSWSDVPDVGRQWIGLRKYGGVIPEKKIQSFMFCFVSV